MIDPWSIGIALAILGMGGTLLSLGLISLLMVLLKRLFPYSPEDAK
jgi:hypothetical protein